MSGQHVAFVNPPCKDYSSLDIGITVAATHLNERTQHRGSIVDLVFSRHRWKDYLATELACLQPDWVGMATNRLYLSHVKEVADECHRLGYRVVVGGHEATTQPGPTLVATGADALATGDAETGLKAMLDAYAEHPDDWQPRIWQGSFVPDLDSVVIPNYALWPTLEQYRWALGGLLYVQGSRGCPHQCSYCDAKNIAGAVPGHYYRVMTPRRYVEMLCDMERRFHFRVHQCFDPVFSVDPKWVREFADEYHRQGARTPLSVFARIDQLDLGRIADLKRANVKIVRVGVEAGSERIRYDVFAKHISTDRIRQVRQLLKEAGIIATAYFIVGSPYETHATIRETINLARELDFERCPIFVYKVLTEQGAEQMKGCGAKLHLERSENISWGAVADLPGLPAWRIELYQKEAYFWTFGRRLLRLIARQKLGYFANLVRYLVQCQRAGLDLNYALAYFHVYYGPNALS